MRKVQEVPVREESERMIQLADSDRKEGVKQERQMLQQHYTPGELARRWGFSDDFVRELFRGEQGVILINRAEKMHKRGYSTMRIPESVAERVYLALVSKRPTSGAAGSSVVARIQA